MWAGERASVAMGVKAGPNQRESQPGLTQARPRRRGAPNPAQVCGWSRREPHIWGRLRVPRQKDARPARWPAPHPNQPQPTRVRDCGTRANRSARGGIQNRWRNGSDARESFHGITWRQHRHCRPQLARRAGCAPRRLRDLQPAARKQKPRERNSPKIIRSMRTVDADGQRRRSMGEIEGVVCDRSRLLPIS